MAEFPFRVEQVFYTNLVEQIEGIGNDQSDRRVVFLFFLLHFLNPFLILILIVLKSRLCIHFVTFDILKDLFDIDHRSLLHVDVLIEDVVFSLRLFSHFCSICLFCAQEHFFFVDHSKQLQFLPPVLWVHFLYKITKNGFTFIQCLELKILEVYNRVVFNDLSDPVDVDVVKLGDDAGSNQAMLDPQLSFLGGDENELVKIIEDELE